MKYRSNFQSLIGETDEYERFFDIYAKAPYHLTINTPLLILDDKDKDHRGEHGDNLSISKTIAQALPACYPLPFSNLALLL